MLARAARLRKEREFRAVFARRAPHGAGKTRVRSSECLSVHLRIAPVAVVGDPDATPDKTRCEPAAVRFGFSISKKVAKRAHDRNRLKRRLSEIARTAIIPNCAPSDNFDCVVVVRKPALELSFAELRREFSFLIGQAGLAAVQRNAASGFSG